MSVEFSVMTYNVHACFGKDGKASPERIAAVIAEFDPDIVALQELDFRLMRSGLPKEHIPAYVPSRGLIMYSFRRTFR